MTVKRTALLLLIFIASLVFWLVWYLPAGVVIKRLPPMVLAGAPLQLTDSVGSSWKGVTNWQWRGHSGTLNWRLDWHGWTPGFDVTLRGVGLAVNGWLTGGDNRLSLEDTQLQLPLALLLDGQRQLQAAGQVSGHIQAFELEGGNITALKGRLHYSGGNGRWLRQSAILPVMNARLFMQHARPVVNVRDVNKALLATASVDKQQMARLKIYRSFAAAVGMSAGGGNRGDAIMTLGQQLNLNF